GGGQPADRPARAPGDGPLRPQADRRPRARPPGHRPGGPAAPLAPGGPRRGGVGDRPRKTRKDTKKNTNGSRGTRRLSTIAEPAAGWVSFYQPGSRSAFRVLSCFFVDDPPWTRTRSPPSSTRSAPCSNCRARTSSAPRPTTTPPAPCNSSKP